jgi:UDP-N-acetylglucosamine diphosphorylase / glucose-1-phosphate thymidylyltransferase / UDP-N-acetylgalactosamine diphosphorylase / glucosamine-1-phosphate N-acetyltransferase / galactosamine-1-phosphate N-acetyltransferase
LKRWLVLFEDAHWRRLRPLTDVVPVSELKFGASTLGQRLVQATKLPLLAVEGRPCVRRASRTIKPGLAAQPAADDTILALNSAAVPGAWLEEVLATPGPALFHSADHVVGAAFEARVAFDVLGRDQEFENFLLARGFPVRELNPKLVDYPWQLIEWNAAAIAEDLATMRPETLGTVHKQAVINGPARVRIEAGASVDALAVIDAREGPVWIHADATIAPHTLVRGPCVVGAGTQLLGGMIARSTIGPQCRIAGEVEECIWQGYANKRHHGFVGHSAIGEWANLGALTTTSDLKNNYGTIRVWIDDREIESGVSKLGALIGAHVKTGIGTLLPTGASIGVGANLFGGGQYAPKRVPAFTWWDGERSVEHRLVQFLDTARIAMLRRDVALSDADRELLEQLFQATQRERPSTPAAVKPVA